VLLLAAACAHRPPAPEAAPSVDTTRPTTEPGPPPEEPAPAHRTETGLASYYGRRHKGLRTASGVRYDPAALTCAHRTAPFGARLRVTDLETGRQVVVTVNDRGPFVRGRIVDLSLAAAVELGMVERGVARVRVERLPR
jgi:rare lipoprotein A